MTDFNQLVFSVLLAAGVLGVVYLVVSGLLEYIKWSRFKRAFDRECKEIDERVRKTGHF